MADKILAVVESTLTDLPVIPTTSDATKAAMQKLVEVWRALEDANAQQHADLIKIVGGKIFGEEDFGDALLEIVQTI